MNMNCIYAERHLIPAENEARFRSNRKYDLNTVISDIGNDTCQLFHSVQVELSVVICKGGCTHLDNYSFI